ncbi:MAG: ABC transporter permease [Bdellovibrionales bacterium]|nr:ABC transporter permease [Bdellovibrionales bacterium]
MNYLARKVKGRSLWSDALRRLLGDPFAVVSFLVIVSYVVIAVLAKTGLLAADWQAEIGPSRGAPDFSKDWHFWLGLDIFGRSVTAKIIQGTYTALYVGLMTSLIAIPIGVTLGALAGYFGGWVDEVVSFLYTTVSNIPELLLLVAIAFALGKGLMSVNWALGMTSWVSLARLVRAEFIKHKNREYVAAAAALGGGHARRIFRHIMPNVVHIIIISFSLRFVTAIKSEVILTYLGLGAQSGSASWGLMIDDAKGELVQGVWWGLAGVTVAMFFICLSFSLFADALRDAVDPKLRT